MSGNLHFGGQSLDRSVFEQRCKQAASVLKAQGVQPDDAVAILLRNEPAYLCLIEACRYVGAPYVALNWHGSAAEIAHILEDSQAKVLVGHSDLLENLDNSLAQATIFSIATPASIVDRYKLDDVNSQYPSFDAATDAAAAIDGPAEKVRGLFAYTSGSTGRPKGIKRPADPDGPDRYMMYQLFAQALLQVKAGDKFYVAAPLYHSAPNTLSLSAFSTGNVDIIIEPQFDPEQFLRAVEQYKITHAYIVPTMMVRLLKLPQSIRQQYDVSSLRYSISTGSPCPIEVKKSMIDWFGSIFYESYGASELGFMTLISSDEAKVKPGSVGRAREGMQIKILNDELRALPAGETGTIYIHSEMGAGFSYTNAEGDLDDQELDGFATVGDIGYLDHDDYLFISDRKKDMIISGGANIFPSEIEAEVIKMPKISDCAVFSAPDDEFGESIVVAVQLLDNEKLDLKELQDFLNGNLARFKMPRKLDIHDSLPREDSGKIFKKHLKDPYWKDTGRSI